MASYLLNAADDAMLRWKAAAKQRRIPFSEFLRQAAETYAAMPPSVGPTKPATTVAARYEDTPKPVRFRLRR